MKIYRVGGSVRDSLMGLTPHDHDYVVVGATPAEMEALGYVQVGKDFPVYLHPETKEEYALARVERKSGLKHTDFETVFDTSVTIEDDLMRRDLTINAIAQDIETGEYIDPFFGQLDIRKKVLRHVSEAFKEDPLRILRLARFAARFPDFDLDVGTFCMCKEMVEKGELDHISQERIWQETKKAFLTDHPEIFYKKMWEFRASAYIFAKETDVAVDYEQVARVAQASQHLPDDRKLAIRFGEFASWTYFDVNQDAKAMKALLNKSKIPTDIADVAIFMGQNLDHIEFHLNTYSRSPEQIAELLRKMKLRPLLQRNPEFINDLIMMMRGSPNCFGDIDMMRVKDIFEAFLDTKEFLSCEVKRYRWYHHREPTPEEIKQMVEMIQVANISVTCDKYFRFQVDQIPQPHMSIIRRLK